MATTVALMLVLVGCSAGVNDDRAGTETPYPIRTIGAGTPTTAALAISAVTLDLAGEAALSTAIAADPTNASLLRQRATVRDALADLDGAIADLDAAFALIPPDAAGSVFRGRMLLRRGHWERALADFDAAIHRDPGLGDAYVARALARSALARGDANLYRAALDDLTLARATTDPPSSIPATRARILLDRHAFRADPADLEMVIEAGRADPPVNTAGTAVTAEAMVRAGDPAGAAALLGSTPPAATGPERAMIEVAVARVALAMGDVSRAAGAVDSALAVDPWSWDAKRLQIELALATGQTEEARQRAAGFLRLLPSDPEVTFLLGRAHAAAGDAPGARETLMTARELLPASPVYLARITQALNALSPGGTPTASPAAVG